MIFLLDTHTFIWTVLNVKNLGKNSKEIISSRKNEICVSTVSLWEISLKISKNIFLFDKLKPKDFLKYAREMDFSIIDMQQNEAISFHELPYKENHKDPFDRMLIWQAITMNMTLISKDELFDQYKKDGLKLIW